MFFEVTGSHARVATCVLVIPKAVLLAFTRTDDAFANGSGGFFRSLAGDVAVFDGRHFDMQIDTIEQRPGNALTISLHLDWAATAFAFEIAEVAARTWIHRCDQHELGRERDAASRARHCHFPVLKRLAHYLQCRSFKLGQLIEKKDAVVSEADFAGIWKRAATEQANIADRMMRIAKRSCGDEGFFGIEQPSDAMNLGRINGFIERERRNNSRNAFGQHRFARPRRTNHQDVVTSGNRDFDGPFNVALALHVAEIEVVSLMVGEEFRQISARREEGNFAAQKGERLSQVLHAVDVDLIHHRGFECVCFGDK